MEAICFVYTYNILAEEPGVAREKKLKNNFEFFFCFGYFLAYRVSQRTWEFSDEFDIVFMNNSLI